MALQQPASFGASTPGTTGSTAKLTPKQVAAMAEQYMLNPSYRPSPTTISEQPLGGLLSSDPTEMATAWDLPQNVGALRLPSGEASSKPADPKALSAVQQGVQMLTLYAKFESGTPLTQAELQAATALGGPVARAAQLLGKGTVIPGHPAIPGKPGKLGSGVTDLPTSLNGMSQDQLPGATAGIPATKDKVTPAKGTAKALVDANKELAQRMESTLGLTPAELSAQGLKGLVPKQVAATMQNAGYGVTAQMTLAQALNVASGQGGSTPMPTIAGNQTVGQYIQGLGQLSKSQLYTMQQALYHGGFYDESYYSGKDYTQGVLDTGTILAFRKAILSTLESNAKGTPASLEQTIAGGASAFPVIGGAGLPADTTAATHTPQANPTQLQGTLENAFQAALGRAPSQSELQAFTNSYQGQLNAGSASLAKAGGTPSGFIDQSTGIPFLPQTPTASQAATSYVQNTDSTAYEGHNVADAFGMLMNLIDRPSTSSLDTVGARPAVST